MSFRYPKGGFIQLFFDPLTPGPLVSYGPIYFVGGVSTNGQNGLNDRISRSSPVQIGSLSDWKSVSAGNAFALATKQDGTMWAWGQNDSGQLGQNDRINRSSPVQIGALTNWSQIAAGNKYSYALKADGTMWSWGTNQDGNLGQDDLVSRSSPVQVGALTTWTQVNCTPGSFNAFGIKTDGTLWAWGRNQSGSLGINNELKRSSPVQIGALTNWSYVNAGGEGTTTAIKTDGTMWSWGSNQNGTLGQNLVYTDNKSSPTQIGALTTWSKLSGRFTTVFAIKNDGTLWGWGRNDYGQIGDNNSVNRSSPVQIGSLTTWSKLGCGSTNNLAIKTDGTLWGWGHNNVGQLGQNDVVARSSPVQIGTSTSWVEANAYNETFAIQGS